MRPPELTKTQALILLIIFVAIGGIILYTPHDAPHIPTKAPTTK